jgi:hypothetical protein
VLLREEDVQPKVTDVEQLKKQVRKMAASKVLAGSSADVGLDLAQMAGCRVRIAAGYGPPGKESAAVPYDRLIWILDGYADIHGPGGQVTHISQGESALLTGGTPYRLNFPQLTLYLCVEAAERP